MPTRDVSATVLRPDGTPWVGAKVYFKLIPGTYLADAAATQLPSSAVQGIAGADGAFRVPLQVNASGVIGTQYQVDDPGGETFYVTVPAGSTTISLSTLRESFAGPSATSYPNLLQAVEDAEAARDAAEASAESADADAAIAAAAADVASCLFFQLDGLPYTSQTVRWVFSDAIVFRAGLAGARLAASVAATASTAITLKKNGVTFATATVALGATTATWVCAADTSINATTDVVTLVFPATPDATLADLVGAIPYDPA